MSFGHSEVMHQSLSINTRVSALIGDKVLGFVKDYDVSAKDPEPMRRSIVSAGDCRVWHSSDTHDHTDVFVLLVCWMFRHDIQAVLQREQFGTSIPLVLNSARSACIS